VGLIFKGMNFAAKSGKQKMPDSWKRSVIVTVFEKKNRLCCDNYRGISRCAKQLASVILQKIKLRTEEALSF